MTAVLTRTERFTQLVADAVHAPSSHNTQPWLFRLTADGIELHADRTRALPVNDPHDRELVMSCGAALANLSAAAVHHHLRPTVEAFPSQDPDHLATVRLDPAPAYSDAREAYGIALRTTWRQAFTARPVPERVQRELLDVVREAGAWAHIVGDAERPALVDLVARADLAQFDSPSWRRELAAWMHPRRSSDGVAAPPTTRLVVSHVDVGDRTARSDAVLTAGAPLLVVLATDEDDEPAWLTAGQALERMLLTAAVGGVQGGFVNQPCQVPAVRAELAELVGRPYPQVMVRLGLPPEHPPVTPRRRPVQDVLLP